MSMEAGSCSVRGALAFVLRVTAAAGVTPARLTRGPRGYVLRYSPARHVLGCLFYGLLSLSSVTYLIWHQATHTELENVTSADPGFSGISFQIFVCATIVLDTTLVFKGMKHTKYLITMLNATQKFQFDLLTRQQDERVEKMDNRRKYLTVVFVFFYLVGIVRNIAAKTSRESHVLIVSTLQQAGYFVMIMHTLRFIFIALVVHGCFQSVNLSLGELYSDVKRGRSTDFFINKSLVIPEEIRRLATAYSALCDVVRELNRSYGASLLITLCFIVYLFGWTGLLLFKILYNVVSFQDIGADRVSEIAENVFRVIINVINVIIIIEPCHRTHNEMLITKTYLTEILHRAPNYGGPVVNELEMFYRLTILERASYSPLQLCTMERLLTLKMITGIISYVVIALQLDL